MVYWGRGVNFGFLLVSREQFILSFCIRGPGSKTAQLLDLSLQIASFILEQFHAHQLFVTPKLLPWNYSSRSVINRDGLSTQEKCVFVFEGGGVVYFLPQHAQTKMGGKIPPLSPSFILFSESNGISIHMGTKEKFCDKSSLLKTQSAQQLNYPLG